MDFNEWRNRYKHRNDISSRLTHLTKGDSSEQAFSTLLKILEEKRLNGSTTESGFIIGNKAAVCLQEAPLNAIAENLLYEKEIREKITERFVIVHLVFDLIKMDLSKGWQTCNI